MVRQPVGIRSLAVSFPRIIRTNEYWKKNHTELIKRAEKKSLAKVFPTQKSLVNNDSSDVWMEAMKPYLSDPFRGAVERRVLDIGESSLTLEEQAVREALNAAEMSLDEIDLILVSSLFPEHITPGNASFLAKKLGFRGATWNIESTCMSALASLQTACAMIRSEEYRNVLVVVSSTYSRYVDENDTFSVYFGDGAGAFIVSPLEKANQGLLGTKILNTSETCGAFFCEFTTDDLGQSRMFIKGNKNAGKIFNRVVGKFMRSCCEEAVKSAGVTLDRIDYFIFHTPTAWYGQFCIDMLGIDPNRTFDTYPRYANIAATLPLANLYHAAQEGKIRENDLILIYTMGFTGNVGAVVMRWGDVALGSVPAPSPTFDRVAVGAC